MTKSARPQQPKNASDPIRVTVAGITVFLQLAINVFVFVSMMALQLSRESYTLLPAATVILVRSRILEKAPEPILITDSEITMSVKFMQA